MQSLISSERDSVFKGSEELPRDSVVLSCWVKEKKRRESSSRRSWHCAHPAREGTRHLLPTSSIFRDNLVSVLCWRPWPGPEQPGGGDLLQVGMCGDGQYTVRMHATECRAGNTLSPLSSWHSLPLPLKWRKDHTQWVRHSRVPWDPGNRGALSLTPTEIKSQHCHFPSSATWSKSLSPSMLQLPPLQTGIVAVPPS